MFHHINTAENFFSSFKRGVIGTYHRMSEAHLGRYCAKFDLRYNTRYRTKAGALPKSSKEHRSPLDLSAN